MTKRTISVAQMKWMVRAVWRPPKRSTSHGNGGIDAGRHGQPGEDDERQHDEDHGQIDELLEDVVVALVREFELHVVPDRRPDVAELLARRAGGRARHGG